MLEYWLTDLRGKTLGTFVGLEGSSVTLTLNEGRTATVTASFDDAVAARVKPLETVTKVAWDRGHLFTGVNVRPQYLGRSRRVVIPSRDPSLRLQAFQVGVRLDGAGLPSNNNTLWGWAGVDQAEIMARLTEHAAPSAFELGLGVPGHGLARGNLPASLNRDRIYELGKSIWEAMLDLTKVINGIDFDLRPVDREDGIYAMLDTYYPMMGSDRSSVALFEYGWGLDNVVDCTVEPAGDIVVNTSFRAGQRTDGTDLTPSTQPLSSAFRNESRNTLGIYSEYVGESDVTLVTTLTEHANAAVQTYGFPPFFVTLTPAQDDGSGYSIDPLTGSLVMLPKSYGQPPVLGPGADYWLGDIVSVVVRDGPAFDFDLVGRVVQIVLSNTSTGAVVSQLKLAPVLGGGYRLPGVLPPSFLREFISMRERLRLAQVVQ